MTAATGTTKPKDKRIWLALAFAGPALLILAGLVVWPAIQTVIDSFYDAAGQNFVGFDNYVGMFRFERMQIAIRNSIIWVVVFPVVVTTIGLILAVLSEKVKWRTAFRLILFMPAAVAILSSGIIWRIMYDTDPNLGSINAVINISASLVNPEGTLTGAAPSDDVAVLDDSGLTLPVEVGSDGAAARIGLLRILASDLPE
ncbi:MAG: carbohydrate ABC transporter permease, partial [Acidimicrobiia bacterium]